MQQYTGKPLHRIIQFFLIELAHSELVLFAWNWLCRHDESEGIAIEDDAGRCSPAINGPMANEERLEIREIMDAERPRGNHNPPVHVDLDQSSGLVGRGDEASDKMKLDWR